MNIDDRVKKDCLSDRYLTKECEEKLQKAREAQLDYIKANLLDECVNDSDRSIEESIQLKYQQVCNFIRSSTVVDTIEDAITLKQTLATAQLTLPRRKLLLTQKIGNYVETVLKVLDVTWSIIEKYKYGKEVEWNRRMDQYYAALADSLLLKVKSLHLSVLMATYDPSLIDALSLIKRMLETRYAEAKTSLDYYNEEIQKYKEMGSEFGIILKAYTQLLDKIQSTKDDIRKNAYSLIHSVFDFTVAMFL